MEASYCDQARPSATRNARTTEPSASTARTTTWLAEQTDGRGWFQTSGFSQIANRECQARLQRSNLPHNEVAFLWLVGLQARAPRIDSNAGDRGLITRRSRVRIPPPLSDGNPLIKRVSAFLGSPKTPENGPGATPGATRGLSEGRSKPLRGVSGPPTFGREKREISGPGSAQNAPGSLGDLGSATGNSGDLPR